MGCRDFAGKTTSRRWYVHLLRAAAHRRNRRCLIDQHFNFNEDDVHFCLSRVKLLSSARGTVRVCPLCDGLGSLRALDPFCAAVDSRVNGAVNGAIDCVEDFAASEACVYVAN